MSTPPQYLPPGSVVPPVATVPAPPALVNTPSWGASPYTPTSGSSFWGGSAPIGSTATVMNTLGMPVAAPEERTPEELMGEIESGLAKLDTVNPELAAQMRAEHGLGPEDEGGLFGFLGDIKDAVVGGGGKALELLSRTSHVVPAFFDPESWDDGSAFNDSWDALMGRNKTNWNEVLQHSGFEGDGAAGFLRSSLGFVGDVLTDPLTYATFGAGAGASVAEKGALTAKTVSTKLATFTDDAVMLGVGKNADEAAEALTRVYNALEKAPARTEQAAQALAGQAGRSVDDAYRQLAADMFEASDNVYNAVYARTFGTWLRKGENMVLESGRVVDPKDIKALIEETVKAGIGKAPKSSEWLYARASAGAMGGARFAPYIPFTQYRYISPMLPGSNALQPLARVARFAAGKSSSKQMERLIRAGEATWDDLALLHGRGLTALRESSDPAQRRIFEKLTAHGRGSSAFYSASERVGGLTANFAKGAQLNRLGLGGYFVAQHAKALKGNLEHVEHHLLYDVVGKEAKSRGLSGRDYLFRLLKDAWNITDDVGSAEDFDTISRYMDAFAGLDDIPASAADVNSGAFDQWFWQRRDVREKLNASANSQGQVSQAVRNELEAELDEMKDLLKEVPAGPKRDVLQALAAVERRGNDVKNEYGVLSADARVANLDAVKEMNPEDVPLFNGGAHASAQEGEWWVTLKNRRMGVTDEDAWGHGDLGVSGVRASRTPRSGDAQQVAVNPRKVLVVEPGATLSSTILTDTPILREATERAQAQMDDLSQAMQAQGAVIMPVSPLHPDNWDNTLAELVTQDLKARGGLEYDAVLFRGGPDGDELVLLGSKEVDAWNQVKVLNDNAPRVAPTRGYFHRMFTKEAQEFLHGVYGDRAVFAVKDLASKARRKAHGMGFKNAEEQARLVITEELRAQGASQAMLDRVAEMPLFERNPLKVHKDYVHDVAETVNGVMSGELAERLNSLGDLLPTRFGRYATIDTARYEVDAGLLKAVAEASPDAAKAAVRFQAKERKLMDAMARAAADDADKLASILEAWRLGKDIDLAGVKNPRLKRLLDAAENKGKVIAREREKALKTKAVIEERLALLAKVEELLHEQGQLWRTLDDAVDPEKHVTWDDLGETAARPLQHSTVNVPGEAQLTAGELALAVEGSDVEDHLLDLMGSLLADAGIDFPVTRLNRVSLQVNAGGGTSFRWAYGDRLDSLTGLVVEWDEGMAYLGRDEGADLWRVEELQLQTPLGLEGSIDVYHGTSRAYDEPLTGRESKGAGRARGAGGDLVGPEHYVSTSSKMAGSYTGKGLDDVEDLMYPDYDGELSYWDDAEEALKNHDRSTAPPNEVTDDELRDMAADVLIEAGIGVDEYGPLATFAQVTRMEEQPGSVAHLTGLRMKVYVEDPETGIEVVLRYQVLGDDVKKQMELLYGVEGAKAPYASLGDLEGWRLDSAMRSPVTAPNVRKGKLRLPKGSVYRADEVLDEETAARIRNGLSEEVGDDVLERMRIEGIHTQLSTELDVRLKETERKLKEMDDLQATADELRARRDSLPVGSPEADAAHKAALAMDEATRAKRLEAVAYVKETKAYKEAEVEPVRAKLAEMQEQGFGMGGWKAEQVASLMGKLSRGEYDSGSSGMDLWYALADTFGSPGEANDFLERLGYEAIHYNGGARLGGGHSHEAFAVFNPTKTIVHNGNWARHAAENGTMTADDLARLLDEGELGVAADGTVLTRSGRARQAGKGGARKVHPRAELEAEARSIGQLLHDLDRADAQRSRTFAFGAEDTGLPKPVTKAQEKVEAAVEGVAQEVDETSARRAASAAKDARRVERLTIEATNAMGELNSALATMEGIQAPLKPAVVIGAASPAGGRTGMRQVNIPGLDDVWVHEFMAEELDSVFRGKPVGALRGAWREFALTPWKKWATYRSPGFHVRNAFGAWFNNHLGGVSKADYIFSQRVMFARDGFKSWSGKAITPEEFRGLGLHLNANFEGVTLTYGDIAGMLADQGIGRANATAVALVEQTAREGAAFKVAAGRAVSGARRVDAGLRKAGALTEDYFRTAAWAAGMRATMGDVYGARAFVMTRHGDYSDLTDTEDFIKDLVPFYKWMRTNVPYQFRMLAEEPGKLLMVQKAQQSIYDAAGVSEDYQASMPEWMNRGLNIPIPFTKGKDDAPTLLSLDLPYGDLYKGTREYLSSMLPMGLDVIESTALKQDTFTGMELEGVTQVGGIWNAPGLKQLMAALPGSQTGPNGEVYIRKTFDNVLSAVPVYGRFRNWASGDPNRVEKRWGSITSYFFGAPVRDIDLTLDEKAFYYDEVLPTLTAYTSMGYVFPTKEQLQAAGLLALTPTPDAAALWPTGVVGSLPTTTTGEAA